MEYMYMHIFDAVLHGYNTMQYNTRALERATHSSYITVGANYRYSLLISYDHIAPSFFNDGLSLRPQSGLNHLDHDLISDDVLTATYLMRLRLKYPYITGFANSINISFPMYVYVEYITDTPLEYSTKMFLRFSPGNPDS